LLELRDSHRFGGITGARFRTLALVVTALPAVTAGASLAISSRGLILLLLGRRFLNDNVVPRDNIKRFVAVVVSRTIGSDITVLGDTAVCVGFLLMALAEELSIDLLISALTSKATLEPDASITPDFVVVGVNALGIRSLAGYTRFPGHSAFEIVYSLDELGIVKVTERSDILSEPFLGLLNRELRGHGSRSHL
tara:strand:- start:255 stop:836 length:582 start_codon:yes stop_codon:yes gene_type:complete